MRVLLHALLALALAACARTTPSRSTPAAPTQWEPEVERFEAADRERPPAPGGVVFVGSSSIRLWPSLDRDFPDVRLVNRGFGGSELGDVVALADRIVVPYRPRVVILYAGDNDLAAGKSPEQVFEAYRSFVALVRRELPGTRVAFIAIKPSPARWSLVDRVREANRLIRDHAQSDSSLGFVDVFTPMLDEAGQPRHELFVEDGLHMNAAGYALWRELVAPVLR
jgi:lysophospholipase L1-like esterase